FLSIFFFSSRRRHTRSKRDWSSDVCSSDLDIGQLRGVRRGARVDEDVPDALGHEHPPIGREGQVPRDREPGSNGRRGQSRHGTRDRKSTRLNSSHVSISYAVFCLKKKKKEE